MKKYVFLVLVLLLGTSYPVMAESSPSANPNTAYSLSSTESTVTQTNSMDSSDQDTAKKKRKKKSKMKTWQKIGAGALIVLIAVFYVATGGEGWHSR